MKCTSFSRFLVHFAVLPLTAILLAFAAKAASDGSAATGTTEKAPPADSNDALQMALERRFGKPSAIVPNMEDSKGRKFDEIIWQPENLQISARRKSGVIVQFTISRNPVPGNAIIFLKNDAIMKEFANGMDWDQKGKAKTLVGSNEVYLRSDGSLYALTSEMGVWFLIPSEFKDKFPTFK